MIGEEGEGALRLPLRALGACPALEGATSTWICSGLNWANVDSHLDTGLKRYWTKIVYGTNNQVPISGEYTLLHEHIQISDDNDNLSFSISVSKARFSFQIA